MARPQHNVAISTDEQSVVAIGHRHANTPISQTQHSSELTSFPSTKLVHAAQWYDIGRSVE